MESKVQKMKKSTDVAEENDGVTAEKIKFPLYVFPETMKTVDILYKSDNCSSRTEFMEKAIRFYCGYLLQNKPELVDYLAPQIATITEGIVKGAVKKAQQSPWIPSIWKPTGFNISHSKKELSNLEKRVQQTQRHKNCVFAVLKMWKIF